ncbi:hypothetical protein [Nocardia sp. NPDC058497]|uniref:hypothetical protein n=1 Tax=Nocardia sp. NPDC058497 TaxID=3346529 RepID=UPI003656FCA0
MPPADAILPLPDGLFLVETVDDGCSYGSTSACAREFVIGGTSGAPDDVAARVRLHLQESHGWTLTPGTRSNDVRDYWSSTYPRTQGWALDQYRARVSVSIHHERVTVRLAYLDDW